MSNRTWIKIVVVFCAVSMIVAQEPHVHIIGIIGIVSGLGVLALGEK